MAIVEITAEQANHLIETKGALPVDIREPHENKGGHIPRDLFHPLSAIPSKIDARGKPVIFYCNTGATTAKVGEKLVEVAGGQAFALQGGFAAWKKWGLPIAGGGGVQVPQKPAGMMGRLLGMG